MIFTEDNSSEDRIVCIGASMNIVQRRLTGKWSEGSNYSGLDQKMFWVPDEKLKGLVLPEQLGRERDLSYLQRA